MGPENSGKGVCMKVMWARSNCMKMVPSSLGPGRGAISNIGDIGAYSPPGTRTFL